MFSKSDEPRDIGSEKDDESTHNASSLVFLFLPEGDEGKKFLFTGYATRESFDRVFLSDYLNDCYWMKIPHHGSIHNLTTDLIGQINPEVAAYISAPGNDKYPAAEIIDELKKCGVKVFATYHHGSLIHRRGFPLRPGWKSAEPL